MVEDQHKLNGATEEEKEEEEEEVMNNEAANRSTVVSEVNHHIEPLTILPAVVPSSSSQVVQITPVNPTPKATPRAKVPLEKGYSQMVWLKLLRTEPDLAGLKGKSNKRLIPIEEVKQHCTEEDAWTVLRGRVYNISPYIRFHPGGRDMLMKGAGKDCTSLFILVYTRHLFDPWTSAKLVIMFIKQLLVQTSQSQPKLYSFLRILAKECSFRALKLLSCSQPPQKYFTVAVKLTLAAIYPAMGVSLLRKLMKRSTNFNGAVAQIEFWMMR